MLEYLETHLATSTSPRTLSKYNYFRSNLKLFVDDKLDQYYHNGVSYTYGIRLIRSICELVDLDYMQHSFINDIDRYLIYVQNLRNNIIEKYDTVISGSVYQRYYISKSYTKEYITSIEDVNTLNYLPFNKDFNTWKDIEMLKIWWHDSDEFSLNLLSNKLKFDKQYPEKCLILIDPIGLAFLWYKFNIEVVPTLEKDTFLPVYFCHHYLYPKLYYQITDIWLLKQFNHLLSITDIEEVKSIKNTDIETNKQYGKIPVSYTEAMTELYKEFRLIEQGNIKSSAILNSKILLNSSIYDLYRQATTRWNTDDTTQHLYLHILKDLDIFEIIFKLYRLFPKGANYDSLIRELKIQINRIYNKKPWNNARNISMKEYLKTRIMKLKEKIYM